MVSIFCIQIYFNLWRSGKIKTNGYFSHEETAAGVDFLTGSSSRPFHIPSTCLDSMTCFKFNSAGSAVHPVVVTTVSGESFVIPNILQASFKNVSAACHKAKIVGNSVDVCKVNRMDKLTSIKRFDPLRLRYGEFSKPTGIYMSVPINNWISFSNLSTNLEKCFRA